MIHKICTLNESLVVQFPDWLNCTFFLTVATAAILLGEEQMRNSGADDLLHVPV